MSSNEVYFILSIVVAGYFFYKFIDYTTRKSVEKWWKKNKDNEK